jgi:hypothetical protein
VLRLGLAGVVPQWLITSDECPTAQQITLGLPRSLEAATRNLNDRGQTVTSHHEDSYQDPGLFESSFISTTNTYMVGPS